MKLNLCKKSVTSNFTRLFCWWTLWVFDALSWEFHQSVSYIEGSWTFGSFWIILTFSRWLEKETTKIEHLSPLVWRHWCFYFLLINIWFNLNISKNALKFFQIVKWRSRKIFVNFLGNSVLYFQTSKRYRYIGTWNVQWTWKMMRTSLQQIFMFYSIAFLVNYILILRISLTFVHVYNSAILETCFANCCKLWIINLARFRDIVNKNNSLKRCSYKQL